MLGADARLLTEGEEIVSHDLFAKWNSKKTITGEDEDEETELKFLTEIRDVRDKQPDSVRAHQTAAEEGALHPRCFVRLEPAVADRFPLCSPISVRASSTNFFWLQPASADAPNWTSCPPRKFSSPPTPKEARQSIPREFYDLLDKNKARSSPPRPPTPNKPHPRIAAARMMPTS